MTVWTKAKEDLLIELAKSETRTEEHSGLMFDDKRTLLMPFLESVRAEQDSDKAPRSEPNYPNAESGPPCEEKVCETAEEACKVFGGVDTKDESPSKTSWGMPTFLEGQSLSELGIPDGSIPLCRTTGDRVEILAWIGPARPPLVVSSEGFSDGVPGYAFLKVEVTETTEDEKLCSVCGKPSEDMHSHPGDTLHFDEIDGPVVNVTRPEPTPDPFSDEDVEEMARVLYEAWRDAGGRKIGAFGDWRHVNNVVREIWYKVAREALGRQHKAVHLERKERHAAIDREHKARAEAASAIREALGGEAGPSLVQLAGTVRKDRDEWRTQTREARERHDEFQKEGDKYLEIIKELERFRTEAKATLGAQAKRISEVKSQRDAAVDQLTARNDYEKAEKTLLDELDEAQSERDSLSRRLSESTMTIVDIEDAVEEAGIHRHDVLGMVKAMIADANAQSERFEEIVAERNLYEDKWRDGVAVELRLTKERDEWETKADHRSQDIDRLEKEFAQVSKDRTEATDRNKDFADQVKAIREQRDAAERKLETLLGPEGSPARYIEDPLVVSTAALEREQKAFEDEFERVENERDGLEAERGLAVDRTLRAEKERDEAKKDTTMWHDYFENLAGAIGVDMKDGGIVEDAFDAARTILAKASTRDSHMIRASNAETESAGVTARLQKAEEDRNKLCGDLQQSQSRRGELREQLNTLKRKLLSLGA